MGTKFKVEFEVEVPAESTEAQVVEWLSFQLGESCSIMSSNPLMCHDIEATKVYAWVQK